jgi:thymidylate synthase ThyX
VAWEFYGQAPDFISDPDTDPTNIPMGFTPAGETEEGTFWDACKAEYQRRLDAGWPNEIARGCMPVESMTRFWCAGFDRDWEAFLKLRDDAHAQPEIRVFAQWISGHLKAKKEIVG